MINNASKLRPTQKLRIRLISGHHLPKSASKKIKGNVIQPYISVKLRGHVLDEAEFTTEVVPKVNLERNLKTDYYAIFLFLFTERIQSNLGKLH